MPLFYVTVGGARTYTVSGDLLQDGRKNILVFSAETTTVGAARTVNVANNQNITVGSGRAVNVSGSETVTVGSSRATSVGRNPVVLHFFRSQGKHEEAVYYKIVLSNATISEAVGQGRRLFSFHFGAAATLGHPPHPGFVAKLGRPG